MTPETRTRRPGQGEGAVSSETNDDATLRLGNDKGCAIRRHRRDCRAVDRAADRIYGIAEPYPYPGDAA